jgi:hypothetical protein
MADRWWRLQKRQDETPWLPIAAEHECSGCGQIVFYRRVGDPKTDVSGAPHECREQAPALAPTEAMAVRRDPIPAATAPRGSGVLPRPPASSQPKPRALPPVIEL